MKIFYAIVLYFFCLSVSAQNVEIPDSNLLEKAFLQKSFREIGLNINFNLHQVEKIEREFFLEKTRGYGKEFSLGLYFDQRILSGLMISSELSVSYNRETVDIRSGFVSGRFESALGKEFDLEGAINFENWKIELPLFLRFYYWRKQKVFLDLGIFGTRIFKDKNQINALKSTYLSFDQGMIIVHSPPLMENLEEALSSNKLNWGWRVRIGKNFIFNNDDYQLGLLYTRNNIQVEEPFYFFIKNHLGVFFRRSLVWK